MANILKYSRIPRINRLLNQKILLLFKTITGIIIIVYDFSNVFNTYIKIKFYINTYYNKRNSFTVLMNL